MRAVPIWCAVMYGRLASWNPAAMAVEHHHHPHLIRQVCEPLVRMQDPPHHLFFM